MKVSNLLRLVIGIITAAACIRGIIDLAVIPRTAGDYMSLLVVMGIALTTSSVILSFLEDG